jgi:hypothetical protein
MRTCGGTADTTKLTLLGWVVVASLGAFSEGTAQRAPRVERLDGNPIITPEMLSGTSGEDINGPSLIRIPDWLPNPLGRYYLYFSHHKGEYIRLAYADSVTGPWTVYEPGTLRIEQTRCNTIPRSDMVAYKHVASPDVHVDHAPRKSACTFTATSFWARIQTTLRSTLRSRSSRRPRMG